MRFLLYFCFRPAGIQFSFFPLGPVFRPWCTFEVNSPDDRHASEVLNFSPPPFPQVFALNQFPFPEIILSTLLAGAFLHKSSTQSAPTNP